MEGEGERFGLGVCFFEGCGGVFEGDYDCDKLFRRRYATRFGGLS